MLKMKSRTETETLIFVVLNVKKIVWKYTLLNMKLLVISKPGYGDIVHRINTSLGYSLQEW
jgi:hypothetical protein